MLVLSVHDAPRTHNRITIVPQIELGTSLAEGVFTLLSLRVMWVGRAGGWRVCGWVWVGVGLVGLVVGAGLAERGVEL